MALSRKKFLKTSTVYALEMIYWLKERNVLFIEQPLPKHNLEDMAWVTERSPLPAQNKFPQKEWIISNPEKYGYNSTKLEEAHRYLIDSMKTTGLVVIVGGEMIFKFGSIERISYIASCRKSILANHMANLFQPIESDH